MSQERNYRKQLRQDHLATFQTVVKETDLQIQADTNLAVEARESILLHRASIESFIRQYPDFATSLTPLHFKNPLPPIIADMLDAGFHAGVGPMASVAGAIAASVGTDLLNHSSEIIVENGGDIFFRIQHPITIGIFANRSVLNMHIGLEIAADNRPFSVCTSSGTVGHSLSLGKADAVTVVSRSCALADAAATAIANRVHTKSDIQAAVEFGKHIKGVKGLVVIMDDKAGIWGDLNVVRL
jgi:uncharacterized protein